jgi:hypothetical protein
MWDGYDGEFLDPGEVSGVAGVEGQVVGDGYSGDHRVIGTCCRFASDPTQSGGDSSEGAGGSGVEWKRLEISLCLLEVGLTGGPFLVGRRDKGSHRQFGEGDGRYQRFVGEGVSVLDPTEQNQRAGVENPEGHRSGGRIEDPIEVVTQLIGVDTRELSTVSDDHIKRLRFRTERAQFGDGLSGAGDRKPLTFASPVDHFAAVVAQFTDRDF